VSELLAAGPAIQPTDPREVVEGAPTRPMPPRAPQSCGWVTGIKGRVYICR